MLLQGASSLRTGISAPMVQYTCSARYSRADRRLPLPWREHGMIVCKSSGFSQVALGLLSGPPLHLQGLFQQGVPWELLHLEGVGSGSRKWRHPGSV